MSRPVGTTYKHDRSTFTGFLAQRREDLGLSQAEVARRIGKHTTTMNNYERGVIAPDIDIAIMWANALDVDVTLIPRRS